MDARPPLVVPALVVGVLAFSSSAILVRLAGDVPPASIISLRTMIAAALLVPLWPRVRREMQQRLADRGRRSLLLVGLFLAIHFAAWVESLKFTSVASASVLVSTSPLFLALLAQFAFREPIGRWTWGAVGAGVVGAALIGIGDAEGGSGRAPALGNSLAVAAAAVFALYLVLGGRVRQKLSWAGFVVPVYTVTALLLVGYATARGVLGVGWTPRVWLLCAAMAVGPQLIGHGSYGYALRYVPPVVLGLLSLMEPIGSSFLAYVLFDERPAPLAFAGMALTLFAVATVLVAPRIQARYRGSKAASGSS